MAIYVVHVEGHAYCEIEFEDEAFPSGSKNLIDYIHLHEGFGISAPTLTMLLMDQAGTLQNELNLTDGTKCTLMLAKTGTTDQRIRRSFRLWSIAREITGEGPHIRVVFVLDAPKWIAGVYCENYRMTSAQAMAQMASNAGLRYDGPTTPTEDYMNWLNINTTRASFSEDIAMRGYQSASSCMSRVLTLDGVLRYKNLFDVLRSDAVATLMLNTQGEGKKEPKYSIRETSEIAASGLMTHWFNYGQVQYEHTMDNANQKKSDRILSPLLGPAFPINDKVKSLIDSVTGARVTYVGFDPGTEPNLGSNVHEFYERALYQNLRSLGLFTQKIKVLTDEFTGLSSFDCVDYSQLDPDGNQFVESRSLNGKYLIGGKTIRIKNGHNYSEVFDLIRTYVSLPGPAKLTGGVNNKKTQVNANAGSINLTNDRVKELAGGQVRTVAATPASVAGTSVSEAQATNDLLASLVAYDNANPRIPAIPLGGQGTLSQSDPAIVAQTNLAKSIDQAHRSNGGLSDVLSNSAAGFNPEEALTVKKLPEAVVTTTANQSINNVLENEGRAPETADRLDKKSGLTKDYAILKSLGTTVEKLVLDRFVGGGRRKSRIQTEGILSMMSVVTSTKNPKDSFVTDPQRGGVFIQDFIDRGEIPPRSVLRVVQREERNRNAGTNFTFSASKFGLEPADVEIRPSDVVRHAQNLTKGKESPEQYLRDEGASAYSSVFGQMLPRDAKTLVQNINANSDRVDAAYDEDEYIVGHPTKTATQSGFTNVGGVLKKTSTVVGIEPNININSRQAENIVEDAITGEKNTTGYSKVFDFTYGEEGVGPVVEKVVNKERVTDADNASAIGDVIETNREVVSWSEFTRMGSNNAHRNAENNPSGPQPASDAQLYPDEDYIAWRYPDSEDTMTVMEEGDGEAYSMTGDVIA